MTLIDIYDKMPDVEFLDEASKLLGRPFDEVVDEVEDYMKCDFKKDINRRFEEY